MKLLHVSGPGSHHQGIQKYNSLQSLVNWIPGRWWPGAGTCRNFMWYVRFIIILYAFVIYCNNQSKSSNIHQLLTRNINFVTQEENVDFFKGIYKYLFKNQQYALPYSSTHSRHKLHSSM